MNISPLNWEPMNVIFLESFWYVMGVSHWCGLKVNIEYTDCTIGECTWHAGVMYMACIAHVQVMFVVRSRFITTGK